MNKRTIYYFFGPQVRRMLRRIYYLPIDIFDLFFGRRDKLTPPKGKIFIGSGDFKKQGENLLKQLIEFGGLKPIHRVLDVGCGIGRLTVPLTQYLDKQGSYEGFDIVKSGIDWCKKHISNRYENFNFIHIDLKNDLYNLKTKNQADSFVFPYGNEEFDFVFLFSVFTHMMPNDIENYLYQINRVLKKGGKCLATFFIINEESSALMFQNDGLVFSHIFENYSLHNKDVKEANVGLHELYLKDIISKNNFRIENLKYGYWSGKKKTDCLDFQDTILITK